MTRAGRPSATIRIACIVLLTAALPVIAWGQAAAPAAPTKVRSVLIVPYATTDLLRDEQWLGEAAAQPVMSAFRQMPGLIQVDRARLKTLPQPEMWDEASTVAAARSMHADVAMFGEMRRSGGDLVLLGRWVEIRGERVERGQLDPIVVPEGGLLDRLRSLPAAYAKAMKISVTEPEAARMQKWAVGTTSPRAWEAYVRGRIAAYRDTADGNEAALDALSRAIEADSQFVLAQYARATVHQTLGNRWKASADFRASAQIDPTFPESYKGLGDLYLTAPRRLFDEAVGAYEKAIDLRPFYAEAYVGLGDARAAKGDVDGAIGAYQRALIHNPLSGKVFASLGKIYYSEKGLYYEAVQAYKKAVDLDPINSEARLGLAEVYEDKGLYQEAIGEYRKVVELDGKNTGALYNLALVYERVDPKESIILWEKYIALAGPQPTEKDWVDVAKLHLRKLKSQFEKDK